MALSLFGPLRKWAAGSATVQRLAPPALRALRAALRPEAGGPDRRRRRGLGGGARALQHRQPDRRRRSQARHEPVARVTERDCHAGGRHGPAVRRRRVRRRLLELGDRARSARAAAGLRGRDGPRRRALLRADAEPLVPDRAALPAAALPVPARAACGWRSTAASRSAGRRKGEWEEITLLAPATCAGSSPTPRSTARRCSG